jgi:hypothetical protein
VQHRQLLGKMRRLVPTGPTATACPHLNLNTRIAGANALNNSALISDKGGRGVGNPSSSRQQLSAGLGMTLVSTEIIRY